MSTPYSAGPMRSSSDLEEMSDKQFIVIGLSDSRSQWFTPEVRELITSGHVFSGGRRHHEIVKDLLPEGCVWIDIVVPL